MSRTMHRPPAGFTLVELAVVLVIFGLLLAMLVVPLSTQFDQQRISETQRRLENINEAILGFAITNGRLPCPADPTIASGAANAGIEAKPGTTCTFAAGVLPWIALGVPETDPWGRRFSYRVRADFADDPVAGMQASFLITDPPAGGNITVTDGAANIATMLVGMVVSHGKNGLGGYRTDGMQVGGAAGDELENADADNTFVSRQNAPNFDDQLLWISPNLLKSRLVAANRLP